MDTEDDRKFFDWDDGNEGHLEDFECEEVEEAVLDPDRIGAEAYNVGGEERWALLGATDAGDILFVVFTHRNGLIRVVTARNATKKEKRRYRQRGK
jgi:uncharacterized DUF497 family protein